MVDLLSAQNSLKAMINRRDYRRGALQTNSDPYQFIRQHFLASCRRHLAWFVASKLMQLRIFGVTPTNGRMQK
jgi:hypothetical protein